MTRTTTALLAAGAALFVALIAWQGAEPIAATMAAAGWGLALVAAFHLLPLAIDAGALRVCFVADPTGSPARDALVARWLGESVNSLLPAGQIGGPLAMVRALAQRGHRLPDAAAAVTVSTTLQAFAQILFALAGLVAFAVAHDAVGGFAVPVLVATLLLAVAVIAFARAQKRGLFGRVLRTVSRAFAARDWSAAASGADRIDAAVLGLYRDRRAMAATFALSFVGWLVGTGEVWLALRFLGHPVDWVDALLLESVGQAIRGAAFAIPGALGVQEGVYLVLAPIVGLPPAAGLALSLAKRAREIALGLPGCLWLLVEERRHRPPLPAVER